MPKTVTLQFHPAFEPPNHDQIVLCTDGEAVMAGWYDEYAPGGARWYWATADEWDGVTAWAELPKPEECL